MWTDDGQGCSELIDFNDVEARTLDRRPRVAIRMAAVPHPRPERFYGRLNVTKKCSRWGSHVFNKHEFAAGFQHAQHLGKRAALIHNATQNKRANRAVNGGGFDRQFLRPCFKNFDLHPEAFAFFRQILIHIGVRFYAYPPDSLCRQVSEVSSGTWTNFQYRAGCLGKQPRFVGREVMVGLVAEPRHKPGENAQADGTGSAANALGIVFDACSIQSIGYNAITGWPP